MPDSRNDNRVIYQLMLVFLIFGILIGYGIGYYIYEEKISHLKNDLFKAEKEYVITKKCLNNLYPFIGSANNPLLVGTPDMWDAYSPESPMVIRIENGYYMYYHAVGKLDGLSCYRIGLATASNPEGPWIKYSGNPVLREGSEGSWDDNGVAIGHVMFIEDGYYMWYMGNRVFNKSTTIWRIGLATANSPEGPWTKYSGNPILNISLDEGWDSRSLYVASVVKVDDKFYLYYVGFREGIDIDGQLGLAISSRSEGPYTKFDLNPILNTSSHDGWDGGQISEAAIFINNGFFHAFYAGYPEKNMRQAYIGYAYSMDGKKWVKFAYPVILTGTSGEWNDDRVSEPHALIDRNKIYIYYTGAKYLNGNSIESLGVSKGDTSFLMTNDEH